MFNQSDYKLVFVVKDKGGKEIFRSFSGKAANEVIEAFGGAATVGKPDIIHVDEIESRAAKLTEGWSPEDRAILQLHFSQQGGINPVIKPKVEAKKPAPKASPTPAAAKKDE